MSFNTSPGRTEYTASAGQTIFPFAFKIYANTDIKVYQTLAGLDPNDITDILILTTDYTVTINGDLGGEITLVSGAAINDAITIVRDLPISRPIEYQTNGDLLATTLNQDQDYQTYLISDQAEINLLNITLQESTQNVSGILPAPDATKVIGWNSTASGLQNYTVGASDIFINILNVDSIADLLLVNTTIYSTVNVRGYYTANDGGGDIFNYDSTQSAVNNGGTIINGWVRQYSGILGARAFGAKFDGVTDDSAAITAALVVGDVSLPNGVTVATFTIPSNRYVYGSGSEKYAAGWDGLGTLIMGGVAFTGSYNSGIEDLSVDNFTTGNAIAGLSQTTEKIRVTRVNTRSATHGQLWEQNSTLQDGSAGGDIIATDCEHWGGANGFVSKMRDVFFINCIAHDVTVQSFVAVSDNINGAAVYSRAINTRFIDCTGDNTKSILRVYSRDEFSTTNANNVQPADNIIWDGGVVDGCTEHGIHIGDFFEAIPTRTQLLPSNVNILNSVITNNLLKGIIITLGDKVTIDGNTFGGNSTGEATAGNNIAYDETDGRVTKLTIGDNNNYVGIAVGAEALIRIAPLNSSAINVSHGSEYLYVTRNTSPVVVNSILSPDPGKVYTILIDDDFTAIDIGGNAFRGKGTKAEIFYDSETLVFLALNTNQFIAAVAGYSATLSLNYTNGTTARSASITGGITLVTAVLPDVSYNGRSYIVDIYAGNAGAKGITAWDTMFKFSTENPAPTLIPDTMGLLLEFYFNGTVFTIKSINTYLV